MKVLIYNPSKPSRSTFVLRAPGDDIRGGVGRSTITIVILIVIPTDNVSIILLVVISTDISLRLYVHVARRDRCGGIGPHII